mmetsp:Transcript_27737/g.61222  ORF Transcript_27737/g.61222 Transcript_27737/m.61222 type:complete len:257 (-) Transcript_27737:1010-1780(-)
MSGCTFLLFATSTAKEQHDEGSCVGDGFPRGSFPEKRPLCACLCVYLIQNNSRSFIMVEALLRLFSPEETKSTSFGSRVFQSIAKTSLHARNNCARSKERMKTICSLFRARPWVASQRTTTSRNGMRCVFSRHPLPPRVYNTAASHGETPRALRLCSVSAPYQKKNKAGATTQGANPVALPETKTRERANGLDRGLATAIRESRIERQTPRIVVGKIVRYSFLQRHDSFSFFGANPHGIHHSRRHYNSSFTNRAGG